MLNVIGRALVVLVELFILERLQGNKQITHLTFYDYIVGIIIGSLSATTIVSHSIALINGAAAILLVGLTAELISFLCKKSVRLKRIFNGESIVLVRGGRLIRDGLVKSHMQVDDVLKECRAKGAFSLTDVQYAILESSGKVSLLLKPDKRPATAADVNAVKPDHGISVDVVVDGHILSDHLRMIGRNELWLLEELKKQGKTDRKSILLASADEAGNLTVDDGTEAPEAMKL